MISVTLIKRFEENQLDIIIITLAVLFIVEQLFSIFFYTWTQFILIPPLKKAYLLITVHRRSNYIT